MFELLKNRTENLQNKVVNKLVNNFIQIWTNNSVCFLTFESTQNIKNKLIVKQKKDA